MATVKLWTDEEAAAVPEIKAVFDDIRATRQSDFVNNFWRALANQPRLLERTWASVKQVMIEPGTLDPLIKELVYIAISTANSCSYCIHSHTCQGTFRSAVCGVPGGRKHGRDDECSCQCTSDPHRSRVPCRIRHLDYESRSRSALPILSICFRFHSSSE